MLLKKTKFVPIFLLLCCFPKLIYSCEILFGFTMCGAAVGCLASVIVYIHCLFVECCNDSWIRLNTTGNNIKTIYWILLLALARLQNQDPMHLYSNKHKQTTHGHSPKVKFWKLASTFFESNEVRSGAPEDKEFSIFHVF